MKKTLSIAWLAVILLATTTSCGYRHVRTAKDITPGNYHGEKLDWRYGAGDIQIQTSKVMGQIVDRWLVKTGYDGQFGKPRLIVTEIDNRTDTYISTGIIRDIIESAAVDDGRYTVIVGDSKNERELDVLMDKISRDPKYNNSSKLTSGQATAPQFLVKVRLTKAVTSDSFYDYEDYRMTVTLYDIETQEIVDSYWDTLRKKVSR